MHCRACRVMHSAAFRVAQLGHQQHLQPSNLVDSGQPRPCIRSNPGNSCSILGVHCQDLGGVKSLIA